MEYLDHRILENGFVEVREINAEGVFHRFAIAPNQTIEKYNQQIESDPDFDKYRTQENADAYEQKLADLQPTQEEIVENKRKQMSLEAGDFKVAINLLSFENGTVQEIFDEQGNDTGLTPLSNLIDNEISNLPPKQKIKFTHLLRNRTEFKRLNKDILLIAKMLEMSDEDIDEFFIKAKKL